MYKYKTEGQSSAVSKMRPAGRGRMLLAKLSQVRQKLIGTEWTRDAVGRNTLLGRTRELSEREALQAKRRPSQGCRIAKIYSSSFLERILRKEPGRACELIGRQTAEGVLSSNIFHDRTVPWHFYVFLPTFLHTGFLCLPKIDRMNTHIETIHQRRCGPGGGKWLHDRQTISFKNTISMIHRSRAFLEDHCNPTLKVRRASDEKTRPELDPPLLRPPRLLCSVADIAVLLGSTFVSPLLLTSKLTLRRISLSIRKAFLPRDEMTLKSPCAF